MKTILIIKCGETFPEIKQKHGDFEEWIINRSNLPTNVFKVINLTAGEQLRHPSEYMAAIITGSQANVDQPLPWMEPLKKWIITARYSNVPVLGICFGHQIIAEALGGRVILNPAGQSVGIVKILLTMEGKKNDIYKNTGNSFESFVHHNYIVENLHSDAQVLATNEKQVIYSFKIGKMYGIQFHPEFTPEIMQHYHDILKTKDANKIRVNIKSSFKNDSIISNFLDLSLIL